MDGTVFRAKATPDRLSAFSDGVCRPYHSIDEPKAGSFPNRNWNGIGLRAAHAFS
jgi:hypothetical protein